MAQPLDGERGEEATAMLLEEYRSYLLNLLYPLTSDRKPYPGGAPPGVESYGTFRGEASLRTWLARIALNVYRSEWRRQRRRPRVSQVLETLQVPDSSAFYQLWEGGG